MPVLDLSDHRRISITLAGSPFCCQQSTHKIPRHGLLLHSRPLPLTDPTVAMQKPSPVYGLSSGILSPIFEFAVNAGQTPEETTQVPLTLSQVCCGWRKSALRHAPLWTNILLGIRGDKSLERSAEFLQRSKTLQVCITFDMQGAREEPPGLKERLAFLSPYGHRLRALHIQGAITAVPIHRFLRDLDYTFTTLEDFQITWGKPTTRRAKPFPVVFGDQVPKALLPYYLQLSPHAKFTNLTRFALKAYDHRLSIQLDQLLEILGGNPTLQHLELEGFYLDSEDEEFDDDDDDDPESEKSIPQLPHLRFLSLRQCLSGAILPRINVPATTDVVLVANDPFDPDEYGSDPPSLLYAFPRRFDELPFIGKFQTLDFEIRDSGITLRASQSSGQYLFIEQVPDTDSLYNNTIEEMALPSTTAFACSDFGPVTTIRASNRLSESNRGAMRDTDSHEVDRWLSSMSDLEKLEISYFPLKFLEGFAGGEDRSIVAVKEVTLTLYPNECGDFKELKAWAKARAEAQLPFKKLEVFLECSVPASKPVDENFVHSLRSSLTEYVKDVAVQVLYSSPQ